MARQDFKAAMENRAWERVELRIRVFRREIAAAIRKLMDGFDSAERNKAVPVIVGILATIRKDANYIAQYGADVDLVILDPQPNGAKTLWPRELWDVERARVVAEVRATMDAVQAMYTAPEPGEDAAQPIPAPEKPQQSAG